MLRRMTPSRDLLARITRLRELFLDEERGHLALADYWRDEQDLLAYDAVLGARIGWKWDAALAEAHDRGLPRSDDAVVLDFGCGSGTAARRYVARFGAREVVCHDRSTAAMMFAVRALQKQVPGLASKPLRKLDDAAPDVLLVSHVLGELDTLGEKTLRTLLARCQTAVIVEPGSRAVARKLSTLRDALLGEFQVVAPCPHAGPCPALASADDWCHFFAPPPPEVFTDSDWVRTTRTLGIDSRSLPYSGLVLTKAPLQVPPPSHRLLGRPAIGRHDATLQLCEASGLTRRTVTKRDQAALWRALKKHPESFRSLPQ
jgi:SAM-dependent methyltransferase